MVRRITEHLALGTQVGIERLEIITHHLMNDGQRRTLRLQDDQTTTAFPPGTTAHLRHHHERMLVSTEVGLIEHAVGIDDAHDRHFLEVESFRNHLRADEQIGAPG